MAPLAPVAQLAQQFLVRIFLYANFLISTFNLYNAFLPYKETYKTLRNYLKAEIENKNKNKNTFKEIHINIYIYIYNKNK